MHVSVGVSECSQGSDFKDPFGMHTGLFWHAYRALLVCIQGSFGMHTSHTAAPESAARLAGNDLYWYIML